MAAEVMTPTVDEPVEEVKIEKPVKEKDPVKAYKKEIKELTNKVMELEAERDEARNLIVAKTKEVERLQKQLDGLCAEFTRITNFIKDTLKVTHKTILMALKED